MFLNLEKDLFLLTELEAITEVWARVLLTKIESSCKFILLV